MAITFSRFSKTSFRFLTLLTLGAITLTVLAESALAAPINGICGSANNSQSVDAPATNLCTAGTPSAVSGIGPWSWTCAGSGGGSDASCSAVQAGGVFYKSSDAGLNWVGKATGIGFNSPIEALAPSPAYASDHTIFLGAGGGTYKSTDSGDHWTQVQSGYSVKAMAISPAFATDRTLFSGQMLSGIYRSTDAGDTWSAANAGLASTQVRSVAISPAFASDHTIFTGILGNGVYKSIDGGSSWTAANAGIATLTGQSLAISPAFSSDQTIFVATTDNHIYRSSDGGASWLHTDTGISGTIYKLAISPTFSADQTVFAATSSGIYKSTDSGNSWVLKKSTAAQTFLAVSPVYSGDQTIFAGIYGDNVYTSITGGNSWGPSSSNFATTRQLSALEISPAFASDHNVFAAAYFAGPRLSVYVDKYPVDFGNVNINSSSPNKQITISNGQFGDANLAITSTTLSGTDTAQFTVLPGTCGSLTPTLVKGGQCSIEVQFNPTSTGNKSATLQINSNDAMSPPSTFSLSGSGVTVSSNITSPVTGYYTNRTNLTVSGSASCLAGEIIAKVEVSTDGGSTWQTATGSGSWSIVVPITAVGSYNIKSRATTVSGIVEPPASGITVTVDRTPPSGTLMSGVLNASANDGGSCLFFYPSICGYLDMSTNSVTWQPATTSPGTNGPLWLRDRAGNMAILNGGTTYSLQVDTSGIGSVHSSPNTDLNCNGTCSQPYIADTFVTLTASPGTNYYFSGWSGACSGTGSCNVTMNQARNVTASFTYALPGAPTGVTVTAGNGQATVSFTAPATSGGSAIIGYTVTSSPGGNTATGSGSPIIVTGLTNGTAYTFTVTATNGNGTGTASTPSNSVTTTSGLFASSTITSPASGTYTNATSLAVSGTATCSGGCTVSLVEVSSDNGVTWQAATGTTSWSTSIPVPTAKSYTFKSRATTSEGIVEVPAGSITVTVDRTPPSGTLALYYGVWTLNASANDGGVCMMVYPNICGQLQMSLDFLAWQPATTNLISGSPLWLRDRAGNTTYISGGSVANSIGGPLCIDGGSYYSFLQHALNAAGSGNTIKLTSTALSENLTLSNNAALTIKGGYDSNLGAVTGITPLNGSLSVQAGSLSIENIAMTGTMTVGSGSVTVTNLTIK